ncbi:MAG: hypothetical protein IT580_21110 [Verrucomicrobiales bacterium]|nr:hypothetical protein [Verrucomicrobiales bacterium]
MKSVALLVLAGALAVLSSGCASSRPAHQAHVDSGHFASTQTVSGHSDLGWTVRPVSDLP